MKIIDLISKLVGFALISSLPSFTNAALSVKDLQSAITESNPIYEVPAGELENVITNLREYSMMVLVTTEDPRYNCQMCGQFDPVYAKIARSIYRKLPVLKDRLFFIRVEASQHLPKLKELGIQSVPQVWGFPDSKKVLGAEKFEKVQRLIGEKTLALVKGESFQDPEWYDLNQAGMEHFVFEMEQGDTWEVVIDKFGTFISSTVSVDVKPAILDSAKEGSFDWFLTIQWFIYVLVFLKIFQKLRQNYGEGIPIWQDKNIYIYFSLVLIFVCVSGLNFSLQRHVPFLSHKDGKILWIAPASNTQFGFEIIISILLHVFFTIVIVGLIDGVPRLKDTNKDIAVLIGAIFMFVLLILAANIYQAKNGGYPLNYFKIF